MTNQWQEQTFPEQTANAPDVYGLSALDREIESLREEIGGLSILIGQRTGRVSELRRQLSEITARVDL